MGRHRFITDLSLKDGRFFVTKLPVIENVLSFSVEVGLILNKALFNLSKFGLRFPVTSYNDNSLFKTLSKFWIILYSVIYPPIAKA